MKFQWKKSLNAVAIAAALISLEAGQMRAAPEFSSTFDTRYITGLGTVDDRMLILVDIDKLMSSSEIGLLSDAMH